MADKNELDIEKVKAANPIEDVVQECGYVLPSRGRYRKCSRPGLGGLVVDVQRQIYHWYSKGQWGDVIAWVMAERGYDFKGAVEELCRRAHLPEPNWGSQTAEQRIAARLQEDALDVAHRVMVGWLAKSPEAQAYLERRGWPYWLGEGEDGTREPGTAVRAMLGYSGEGTPAEREEMGRALSTAGVDLGSPAAVAILGMRGNVLAWAQEHGVTLSDDWISGGYIPSLVGHKRLVYPHARNGRIVYLSARSIEGKYHYNLPIPLVGPKQIYLNHAYTRDADEVVVVEGQADATSLGQWGMAAVALAGVQVDAAAMKPHLEKHRVTYLGLDADKAGQGNAWKTADSIGPLTRLVNWAQPRRSLRVVAVEGTPEAGRERQVLGADDLVLHTALGRTRGPECPEAIPSLLGVLPRMTLTDGAPGAGGRDGVSRPAYYDAAGKLIAVETATDLLRAVRQVMVEPGEAATAVRAYLRELLDWAPSWVDPSTGSGSEVVRPVKDANDLLRAMRGAGLSEDEQQARLRELLDNTLTYVETITRWAGQQAGAARDGALRQCLPVITRLGETELAIYRKDLAKHLNVTVRELQNMLKAAAAAAEKSTAGGEPVFTWGGFVDGWLLEYLYDPESDRAALAWRDPDGNISSGESVSINGRLFQPAPVNDVLRNEAVIFPSKLGEPKEIRELVAYIEMYLRSAYLMPSDQTARMMAYYVLMTWLYDCFETVIYLRAMGGAGSGKSELMRRLGLVCYRTMTANGAGSTSSLFRSLERYKGTVFIDEADIQNSDTENDMVKFYNLGAMRNNPIWRTVEVTGPNGEKDWEAVSFQTFCPKLVAMRKEFRDDAIGSRSLTFKLQPREMAELKAGGIPLSITAAMRARARALRNLLVRWRLKAWQPEIEIDPEFYDLTISARLNQVAGPLLAIAMDDPEQQEEIRKSLRDYYWETILSQSMTIAARVIEAMWKIYKFPDLHKQMVKVEPDGAEMIKIGDVTTITNQLINEMNNEEESEDDNKRSNNRELKPHRVGRILREDLQMQMSSRTRDGFWVYWNEPRLVGLSTRYGVRPDEIGPQPVKPKDEQGSLI